MVAGALNNVLARSTRTLRLLETASPPTFYFPVEAVDGNRLQLAVKSPFVTGHVNEETGALTDGANEPRHHFHSWSACQPQDSRPAITSVVTANPRIAARACSTQAAYWAVV